VAPWVVDRKRPWKMDLPIQDAKIADPDGGGGQNGNGDRFLNLERCTRTVGVLLCGGDKPPGEVKNPAGDGRGSFQSSQCSSGEAFEPTDGFG